MKFTLIRLLYMSEEQIDTLFELVMRVCEEHEAKTSLNQQISVVPQMVAINNREVIQHFTSAGDRCFAYE